jgi:hypothetical protein
VYCLPPKSTRLWRASMKSIFNGPSSPDPTYRPSVSLTPSLSLSLSLSPSHPLMYVTRCASSPAAVPGRDATLERTRQPPRGALPLLSLHPVCLLTLAFLTPAPLPLALSLRRQHAHLPLQLIVSSLRRLQLCSRRCHRVLRCRRPLRRRRVQHREVKSAGGECRWRWAGRAGWKVRGVETVDGLKAGQGHYVQRLV